MNFTDFRKKCVEERISGVYFEGGAQLISELVRSRELDYFFTYRAPVILGDNKAKSIFSGLRPEHLDQALRLRQVHHETFGDDELMRGQMIYPAKLPIDETVFSLG